MNAEARAVTEDEIAFFRHNGWVKLPALVSPDAAAEMLAEAKRLLGPTGAEHRGRDGLDVAFDWWNDYHYPSRQGVEPFRSLARSGAMGRNAQRMMGRPIAVRHFADMIGARAPVGGGKDAETTYHQDYPGGQFDRAGNVVFWIALNDMPPERGVMRFVSGAHREGSLGYRPPDLFDRYPYLLDRYELSEPMHLSPGDATVHGQYTFHGSPANTTDEPRWHFSTIYIPADMRWTGRTFHGRDLAQLEERGLFDDEAFPVIADGDGVTPDDVADLGWRVVGRGHQHGDAWSWDVVRANKVRRVRVVGAADASDARQVIEARLGADEPPAELHAPASPLD
ncbi:MAG TPA: phytanoyl-CoA dioxygenase family protein [Ilumatobacter sp.]|nr:phytanoyl-CoA dioxygenase family protein [Ilumatobacter sp.]